MLYPHPLAPRPSRLHALQHAYCYISFVRTFRFIGQIPLHLPMCTKCAKPKNPSNMCKDVSLLCHHVYSHLIPSHSQMPSIFPFYCRLSSQSPNPPATATTAPLALHTLYAAIHPFPISCFSCTLWLNKFHPLYTFYTAILPLSFYTIYTLYTAINPSPSTRSTRSSAAIALAKAATRLKS